MSKKDFKYSIKIKSTGKPIVTEIVSFGTNENPFPENWGNNGMVTGALEDYKEAIVQNHFDISYEEFSGEEELELPFYSNDCINFAIWLRENDTIENAEQFFHYTDEDMFMYWFNNVKNKTK